MGGVLSYAMTGGVGGFGPELAWKRSTRLGLVRVNPALSPARSTAETRDGRVEDRVASLSMKHGRQVGKELIYAPRWMRWETPTQYRRARGVRGHPQTHIPKCTFPNAHSQMHIPRRTFPDARSQRRPFPRLSALRPGPGHQKWEFGDALPPPCPTVFRQRHPSEATRHARLLPIPTLHRASCHAAASLFYSLILAPSC
jgi:hypothetical protein